MSFEKLQRTRKVSMVVIAALVLALATVFLSACGSQSASSGGATAASSDQAAAIDTSSWTTVGDALAEQTESVSSTWDDKHYVNVFAIDDSYIRIVADVDEEANKKAEEVDWSAEDPSKQIEEAFANLPLTSAEDITGDKVSQEELDVLVGKTGKELADEGYTFSSYYMYGGDETGVQYDKGYFCYAFTFDVSVPESETEDGGKAVQDATVTAVEFLSASDSAVELENL